MWPRTAHAVLAALTALGVVATAAPAHASTGGSAQATGVHAVAGEVLITATTSGAIGMLQGVVDQLTDTPLLPGRTITSVEAATPPAPEGDEGDAFGPVSIAGLLSVDEVSAKTRRVRDGDLSATSALAGASVTVLGLDVLDVGPVSARTTTHPQDDPAAEASVQSLTVFGSPVDVPADGDYVDLELELSTGQILELLEELAPGISGVTGVVGAVVSGRGAVTVEVGSPHEADPTTGAARASGLRATVGLELDASLCVPARGGGCLGEVAVETDATVLHLVLADVAVERPTAIDTGPDWAVLGPLIGLGVLVAAGGGAAAVLTVQRARARAAGREGADARGATSVADGAGRGPGGRP